MQSVITPLHVKMSPCLPAWLQVVALEEGWPQCGVTAEIAAVVMEEAFDDLDAPVMRITGVALLYLYLCVVLGWSMA